MIDKRLILASQSLSRQRMLTNAGVRFEAFPADLDETLIQQQFIDEKPDTIALRLAEAKAMAISAKHQGAYIIGSDQVLVHDGKILSKPGNQEKARDQLRHLRNATHQLIAAVVLVKDGNILWYDLDKATLSVRNFSDDFLDYYLINADKTAFQCVGSYQLESLGVQIFDAIDGNYFTILGMPLLPLLNRLRNEGLLQS